MVGDDGDEVERLVSLRHVGSVQVISGQPVCRIAAHLRRERGNGKERGRRGEGMGEAGRVLGESADVNNARDDDDTLLFLVSDGMH